MFNKPILPNFLHKEEKESETAVSPENKAQPPVDPMAAHATQTGTPI